MEWLLEPLSQPFMQRVLLAGILAVVTTSLIGTWVVLRGLTFMGDALAHGVIPGIALSFALGANLIVGAIGSAVVMTAGIGLVHRKAKLREDAGIGLLFVGMLALGVVILSRLPNFSTSVSTILFGDALGVTWSDVRVQAVAALLTIVLVAVFYRPFMVLSFNEEKAELLGLRPGLSHFVMLGLLTLAIISAFQTVGTLLVFALIVAPPAAASLIARRVPTMMATAAALGSLSILLGLLVSWHADTAAGATMAGMSVLLFFVVLVLRAPFRGRVAEAAA
ncbi:MAG: zinc ABC transporter permease AztB [Nitriliruptoraceae bacterium]